MHPVFYVEPSLFCSLICRECTVVCDVTLVVMLMHVLKQCSMQHLHGDRMIGRGVVLTGSNVACA